MSFRAGKVGSLEGMFNFFGGDAVQLIPDDVDVQLHSATPVLMPDEKVDMAFKAGRDTTVFTNRRVLMIDVKGITGKRVEFFSLKWSSISAFSVETVGQYFDRDAEFVLHLNMTTMKYVCQDLRHGKADLFAIQKYLCNKCLGPDTDPLPDINYHQGHIDQGGLWTWGGDNGRPLDAAEMDRVYHTSPPILQGSEKVEFAFKGRRDMVGSWYFDRWGESAWTVVRYNVKLNPSPLLALCRCFLRPSASFLLTSKVCLVKKCNGRAFLGRA